MQKIRTISGNNNGKITTKKGSWKNCLSSAEKIYVLMA